MFHQEVYNIDYAISNYAKFDHLVELTIINIVIVHFLFELSV